MTTPLESLIATGTKLWLDSVDPELVRSNKALGATGATSNPIIISDLIKSGRFDEDIREMLDHDLDDEQIAWKMTDRLVHDAQRVFADVHKRSRANDGYVSFELDPLLEDADCPLGLDEKIAKYIELGTEWSKNHSNRMIKVPAAPAGLGCLEDLVAAGVTVNVTLLFSDRQYLEARDAVWRGAQRRSSLSEFKSVYSIFVSRIDVYTEQQVPELSDAAQGEVGIVNAKRIWKLNREFWADKNLPLQQEMIFASTGTKKPDDPKDKYVSALAGADIQTNPPATNEAIQQMEDFTFTKQVDQLPSSDILKDIDARVDFARMEQVLMEEGLQKFADPQKGLLQLIAEKRTAMAEA